jgi:sugar lactone lactonase YvrE
MPVAEFARIRALRSSRPNSGVLGHCDHRPNLANSATEGNMTRRPTIRVLLVAVSFALALGASALTGERKLSYRLSPNFLQLPAGMSLGLVSGLGFDSKDNLFVLCRAKPHVFVFDKDGKYLRSWNGDDFTTPHGLRIDADDNVWIADMASHVVQKFTLDGKLLLSLGTKNMPAWDDKHFNKPADACVGPGGDIYIGDGYGNSRIAKFSKDGKFIKDWGKKGNQTGQFAIPHAVSFDAVAGKLYVADRENSRIQIFDATGKHLQTWTNTGKPFGLDRQGGKTYLVDGRTGDMRVLDKDGALLAHWNADPKAGDGPHWLSVDSRGAIYVGFVSGKKVQKWTPDGR